MASVKSVACQAWRIDTPHIDPIAEARLALGLLDLTDLSDHGTAADIDELCAKAVQSNVAAVCIWPRFVPQAVSLLADSSVRVATVVNFPAGGAEYFTRLRHASSFYETADLAVEPVDTDGQRFALGVGTLEARRLRHPIETYGYRLVEPDGCRMLPERLAAYGIAGPDTGRLLRDGHLDRDGRRVTRDEVSVVRPGQRFAFVMDTGLCDGVYALAEHADLLVIESTFLESEAALAAEVGHLTAGQAARVAAESGVRTLVLTHFSQRYADPRRFHDEAREHFTGDLVIAEDLQTVPVPPRRVPSPG